MEDPVMKWTGIILLILTVVLGFAIFMALRDSTVVCEINPLDTRDFYCYEPE